ncbi:MAG: hypothetical protein R2720_10530 [Candidatus Nanopelagicales bacterium]
MVAFAYLDANYLREEKRYRRLYEAVIAGKPLTRFSLNTGEAPVPDGGCSEEWPDSSRLPSWYRRYIPPRRVWTSWSIAPFYLALATGGIGIALTLAAS